MDADFTQTRTSGKASLFFYVMTDGIGRSVVPPIQLPGRLAAHSSVLFYAALWVATGDCERRFPGIEKAPIFLSVLCNY